MFSTIVAGTDGSTTAGLAVEHATALAKANGSVVHLVTAYKPLESLYLAPELVSIDVSAIEPPGETARRIIDEVAEKVRAEGVAVETHVCAGDAAGAILEVAEAIGADLIVVGNRGMQSKSRFLLGSVPNKIAHHAPCTVTIVKTS